jgi:thimet oligopeptidase
MKSLSIILFFCLMMGGCFVISNPKNVESQPFQLTCVQEIIDLFPKDPAEIEQRTTSALAQTEQLLQQCKAIPHHKRTYANTAHVIDTVNRLCQLSVFSNALQIVEMVHPDKTLRDCAHQALQKMSDFFVDNLSNNVALYTAFREYVEGNAQREKLTDEQRYYLKDQLLTFERSGLNLTVVRREKINQLTKELAKLTQDFEVNIATDNRTVMVDSRGLGGLDQDFIKGLKKGDNGSFILGLDYPTYFYVLEHCTVQETRKKCFLAFCNRAYPANDRLLKEIIKKRDELALLTGFESFAHLDLDDTMAQTPAHAQSFVDDIAKRVTKKVEQEYSMLVKELPETVTLDKDGKIKPWDRDFLKSYYKKKHFALDERTITNYFPMNSTIAALLDVYRQFFSIDFKEVAINGLWHPDVRLIAVHTLGDGALLGYLLLDLYPRDNKYNHACHITIVPSTYGQQDEKRVALSLVIANFPKAVGDKPALLRRDDVKTFFHEFGHAIHALLGRTHVASLAGTSVKWDFVELPSQMLEEWLYDYEILKKVSSHYRTGEPLSDELIKKIQQLKQFDSGDITQRQALHASYSLACYAHGADKDPYALLKKLYGAIRTHSAFEPDDHFYASFGHLTGYAARYYGYLWSKVYALDLFYEIKKHGLLNPKIGAKYVHDVLGKGGAADPTDLLVAFLNRKPTSEAFFKDLGL